MTRKQPETRDAKAPRRVLGRGLDALLPVAHAAAQRAESDYQHVGIERVHPRADQPRKRFDPSGLQELADSLREQGMIQPLIVRKKGDGEYEIIAGERRWRAAQRAGLREVPVVVKDVSSDAAFELALVENVQRQDLDPVETASAYQKLIAEHGYTSETLASRIGKDRSTVANTLRLLQLPEEVLDRVIARELSEGHARAILSAQQPELMVRLAREAAEKKWSVRQVEQAARRKPRPQRPAATPRPDADARRSPNVRDLEKRLEAATGLHVAVRQDPQGNSGTLELGYDDLDQLDRFLRLVLGD